ncbi:PaaI family thioesterase [Nocardia sp. 004]|uniref:PaaI family thioesterase n=1 Tax=Nocardia sp. 004 TaxID=3385978 RepID=UPI00399FDD01
MASEDPVLAGLRRLGFVQYSGVQWKEFSPGRSVLSMAPRAEHLNHNKDLHAAVLFGIAETSAMGASVSAIGDWVDETYIVVRDGRIEYKARAKGDTGPFVVTSAFSAELLAKIQADVAARVPVEFEAPADIADSTGKIVASAGFTAVFRPRRA